MKLKTIKIGENSYRELNKFAGMLRLKEHRPVSINETLMQLLAKSRENDISRFAGSWDMSDEELERIQADLDRLWKSWKIELL